MRCFLKAQQRMVGSDSGSLASLTFAAVMGIRRTFLPPPSPWYRATRRNLSLFSTLPRIRATLFVCRFTICHQSNPCAQNYLSLNINTSLYLFLHLFQSDSLATYPSTSSLPQSLSTSVYLSIYLTTHISLFIYPSIHTFYLFLSLHISIYLFF